ncbi:ATP-binding protein [Pseudarthrobacter chlorophenolicus]|uniref:ATP-binding protein n=1 Tax=Pseudarthrobacter chlorophenolicus TaxID=85085 RepID=UPI001F1E633B|nr:ATP-binding protein [Pseudarthrobacter chlorophenolicus]
MATERIVAGLKGGDDDELLVRRAARLAGRGGGELLAVHVRTPSGTRGDSPRALEDLRRTVAGVGGEYHALAGTDVAQVLLDYARSVQATHILVGQSRRRIAGLFRGSVESRVVRDAGDIDVQVVPRDPAVHPMRRVRTELGRGRTMAGFALAAILPAGLQLFLAVVDHSVATAVLVQLAGAVAVALVGGLWPAVAGALWSSLLVNYFSTPPVGDLAIHDPQDVLALGVFVGVSVAVAGVVDGSARRSKEAALARAEAATLADLALGASRSEDSLQALLAESLSVFGVSGAAVVTASADPPQQGWELVAGAGDIPGWEEGPEVAGARTAEELGNRTWLLLFGREIPRTERRLVDAFGVHVRARLERRQLEASRLEISRLAEGNAMRTAILRAVSHDLRTPLAGIKLAAGGLLQDGVGYGPEERRELLETIDECTDRLDGLVGNLLDMSRITAQSVEPLLEPVRWRVAVDHALRTCPDHAVTVMLPANMPAVEADPGLLERAIANIVENALKYAPGAGITISGTPVQQAGPGGHPAGELRIIDHGPGVPARKVVEMFQPFQRLGDADQGTGIGLGLAVAQGFVQAMRGTLDAEETPGGGLTMVIRLPLSAGPPVTGSARAGRAFTGPGGGPAGGAQE